MSLQPYRSRLSGWGRFPVVEGLVLKSENLAAITETASLSHGLGRSYGDSSLPARADLPVADTTLADRLLGFDTATGLLRAEAGVSLLELNRVFLRRGWFVPVSPGTQFVTLGGMVASDVHGKNHHVDGCFGEHVRSLKLRVADGRIVECSDSLEQELFRATLGGMGLTGHILEVEFHDAGDPHALDLGRKRTNRQPRCDGGGAENGCTRVADDRRLGRLPGAGSGVGTRDSDEGTLGGSQRGPQQAPVAETAFSRPVPVSRDCTVQAEHEGVQSRLLLETLPESAAAASFIPIRSSTPWTCWTTGTWSMAGGDLRSINAYCRMRTTTGRRGDFWNCSSPAAGWDSCASSRIAAQRARECFPFLGRACRSPWISRFIPQKRRCWWIG